MSSLKLRTLSGIVFVLLITGCIFIHPILFFALFSLIEFVALTEYMNMCNRVNIRPNRFFVYVSGLLIFTSGFLDFHFGFKFTYALALISISAMYITELYLKKRKRITKYRHGIVRNPLHIPSLHPVLLFSRKLPWKLGSQTRIPPLSYDMDQRYLRLYIRSQLRETPFISVRISQKSWEGAVGGGMATLIIAYFIAPFMELHTWEMLIIGLIAVVFGTFGDLIESMMKRSTGIKDSGNIIPGHGGILDRIDSVLFYRPCDFYLLNFLPINPHLFFFPV